MIIQFMNKALECAHYEIIDDEEPYYGEVPELPGVYATGTTLEECRKNLADVIEGWLILSLRKNMPIPEIDGITAGASPQTTA